MEVNINVSEELKSINETEENSIHPMRILIEILGKQHENDVFNYKWFPDILYLEEKKRKNNRTSKLGAMSSQFILNISM